MDTVLALAIVWTTAGSQSIKLGLVPVWKKSHVLHQMDFMSMFSQTTCDSEWLPLSQRSLFLLSRTVAISSAPHLGEASIPPVAEDSWRERLLLRFLNPRGKLPSAMLDEEETMWLVIGGQTLHESPEKFQCKWLFALEPGNSLPCFQKDPASACAPRADWCRGQLVVLRKHTASNRPSRAGFVSLWTIEDIMQSCTLWTHEVPETSRKGRLWTGKFGFWNWNEETFDDGEQFECENKHLSNRCS